MARVEKEVNIKAIAEAIALLIKDASMQEAAIAITMALNSSLAPEYGYVANINLFPSAFFPEEKQKM